MKVSKIVTFKISTRVVVDSEASEEVTIKQAIGNVAEYRQGGFRTADYVALIM